MKSFLFLIGLAGLLNVAFAQKTQIGIQGGINFSSISGTSTDVNQYSFGDSNTTTGFNIGLMAEIPINDFSLQPGLFFTTKGGSDVSTGKTTTFNYLEVPINLLYYIKSPGVTKLFLGGGPYLGYGIGGSDGIKFGSGDSDVANPDFGLNFTAEFRFVSGFSIRANYEYGLTNLINNDSNFKVSNRVFGASIGFYLKK